MPFLSLVVVAHLISSDAWRLLPDTATKLPIHNQLHFATFGADIPPINRMVLQAVDKVQATQPNGGGYFIGLTAVPAESPIGYPLAFLNQNLLDPPRTTSYCSGSSYAVFIETLNLALGANPPPLTPIQLEAMRMQEPDGGRREDKIKLWGWWNADGPGSQYAMVQYAKVGERIRPENALPGDFLNINWKSGLGHSVVFLGWAYNADHQKCVMYWSSQKRTDGFADDLAPIDKVKDVVFTRLSHPENLTAWDPASPVELAVVGDPVNWP